MTKDSERNDTTTPRGGGDVSGKSAETPRGGGDVSGKDANVPRGGGDVSGKSADRDQDDLTAEESEGTRN